MTDGWVEVPDTKGRVYKKILVPGSGKEPEQGATVRVHYTGTNPSDGQKFDSSYDESFNNHPGKPLSFALGEGRVVKCFDIGVATMKVGEKAMLRCHPRTTYPVHFHPATPGDRVPTILPNIVVDFEMELIS